MSSKLVSVELKPIAGYCIKTTLLTPGILPPPRPSPKSNAANFLEPTPDPTPLPKGLKVFINITWEPKVPPPPEGSEDAIKRAMEGEEIDQNNSSGWFVPMIVSNGRPDKDKAGNPSLVFDCVCHTSIKSRILIDSDFKTFINELALQRIEEQSGLVLSRSIGTPNIASKGKLLPRTVQIPTTLIPSTEDSGNLISNAPSKPLIQEIDSASSTSKASGSSSSDSLLPGLRGILKKSGVSKSSNPVLNGTGSSKSSVNQLDDTPLEWSWSKEESGRLRIDVHVPGLTPAVIQSSTLDVEPRRIILAVPNRRTLDIDLDISDAEIASRVSGLFATTGIINQEKRKDAETTQILQLKRQRDFNVDNTDAQWKSGTGTVSIFL